MQRQIPDEKLDELSYLVEIGNMEKWDNEICKIRSIPPDEKCLICEQQIREKSITLLKEIENGISAYEKEHEHMQVRDECLGIYIPSNVVRRLIQVRKKSLGVRMNPFPGLPRVYPITENDITKLLRLVLYCDSFEDWLTEVRSRTSPAPLRPVNASEQLPPCPKCGSPTFCGNIDGGYTILCLSDTCKWKQQIVAEPEGEHS